MIPSPRWLVFFLIVTLIVPAPAFALRAPQKEHPLQLGGLEEALKNPAISSSISTSVVSSALSRASVGMEESHEGMSSRRQFLGAMATGAGFLEYFLTERVIETEEKHFDLYVLSEDGKEYVAIKKPESPPSKRIFPGEITWLNLSRSDRESFARGFEFSKIPPGYVLQSRHGVSSFADDFQYIYNPRVTVQFQLRGEGLEMVEVLVRHPPIARVGEILGRLTLKVAREWGTYSIALPEDPAAKIVYLGGLSSGKYAFSYPLVLEIHAKGSKENGGLAIRDIVTQTQYKRISFGKVTVAGVAAVAALSAGMAARKYRQGLWNVHLPWRDPVRREMRRLGQITRLVRSLANTPLTVVQCTMSEIVPYEFASERLIYSTVRNDWYDKLLTVLKSVVSADLGAVTSQRFEVLQNLPDEKLADPQTKEVLQHVYRDLIDHNPALRHEGFARRLGIEPTLPPPSEPSQGGLEEAAVGSQQQLEVPSAARTAQPMRFMVDTSKGDSSVLRFAQWAAMLVRAGAGNHIRFAGVATAQELKEAQLQMTDEAGRAMLADYIKTYDPSDPESYQSAFAVAQAMVFDEPRQLHPELVITRMDSIHARWFLDELDRLGIRNLFAPELRDEAEAYRSA